MQSTSQLYRQLISDETHEFDTRLSIGEAGVLITKGGDAITFGGTRISVDRGGADGGYDYGVLIDVETTRKVFANGVPEVGCCVAGEITVRMVQPSGNVPRRAQMVPYVRVVSEDGTQYSEWLRKGTYYVDTRELTANDDGLIILTLHGYDAMLMLEQDYAESSLSWPAKDAAVVREIARNLNIGIDTRTWQAAQNDGRIPYSGRYNIELPSDYTYRETLGYIAAMYGGNWIMNENGELRLILLNELPPETNLLIDHAGFRLVIGSDHILV